MRIKTQITVTMLLFGVAFAVITASTIAINNRLASVMAQQQLADEIARGAIEVGYLADDYLIYRENQQIQRWQAGCAAIAERVASLRPETPEQRALAPSLQAHVGRMKMVFDDIVASAAETPGDSLRALDQLQVAWSRMAVQTLGLAADAARLSALLAAEAERLRAIRSWLSYLTTFVFGASFLITYLTTNRRILRSIASLREGTAIVGSGNLDHTIPVERSDEIGELAAAFNQMTSSLKHTREELQEGQQELRSLSHHLMAVQEEERKHLSRELHDRSGQILSAFNLRLAVLKRKAEGRPDLQQQIDQLVLLADQMAVELHDLVVSLRPSALDRYGLESGLQQLIAAFRQQNAVEVKLEVAGLGEERLDETVEMALYRVVQEGLTNVARHADATQAEVILCRQDDHVRLILRDNGRGFDVADAQHRGRLGLLGIAERVEQLGGTLKIESSPDRGTTLHVEAPAQPN